MEPFTQEGMGPQEYQRWISDLQHEVHTGRRPMDRIVPAAMISPEEADRITDEVESRFERIREMRRLTVQTIAEKRKRDQEHYQQLAGEHYLSPNEYRLRIIHLSMGGDPDDHWRVLRDNMQRTGSY